MFRTIYRTACLVLALLLLCPISSHCGIRDYLNHDDIWYRGKEAGRIAEIVLSHQSPAGGWPKNISTSDRYFSGAREDIRPTFDNGATTDELRFLAKIFNATGNQHHKDSFLTGLNYILSAQYTNGGWPQYYPPGESYHRHITFNDGVMERLMRFVREVATEETYLFLNADLRNDCGRAFKKGVDCILNCQIRIDNRLTVWCAQHDLETLEPRPGRSYELPSLSGAESVGITRLLMSIDSPSEEIKQSVVSAVQWFEMSRIPHIRIERVPDPASPRGWNKVVRHDLDSDGLWARFYTLEDSLPLFADRDGIPKTKLSEIGYERRNGYSWHGNWAEKLISGEYPAWQKRWHLNTITK